MIFLLLFLNISGTFLSQAREAGQTEYEMGIDFERLGRNRDAQKWFHDSAIQGNFEAISKLEYLKKTAERKKGLKTKMAPAKKRTPKIIRVTKDGDLRLPNGNVFRTGIYEPKLHAQLHNQAEKPFYVISGSGCSECEMNRSIYIQTPSDGPLNEALALRYPYPGQVFNSKSTTMIFESKMFFGKCDESSQDSVLWFIRNRNSEGLWEKELFKVSIINGRKEEEVEEEVSPVKLKSLLESLKGGTCHELPGIRQIAEP
ncbi:MAG: hypothetical protein HQM13_09180 [SAR324 cluster bacterium]|nr:hypothetical protein [SAR324 cluster bacterium]